MVSLRESRLPVKDEPNEVERAVLPPAAAATGTMRTLLETAVRLFAQRGYNGVSVRDITSAVGIKASSLYAHYPSKEHLLVELMRLGHEHALAAARQAIADLGADAPPAEQLKAFVRSQVRMNAEFPMLSRVCVNELQALSGDSLATTLGMRLEALTTLLTVLRAGVTTGEFAIDDVFLAGMAIGGMILRVSGWYGGNETGLEFGPVLRPEATPAAQYPVEQVAKKYAELALRMVSRPAPERRP